MAAPQDVWRISGEERSKHDAQFFQLKPVSGFVTGTQARDFFLQSGLPTPVLGQIWTLADINGDGKMDKKEFSIAMHLIKKKLQGYELPKVLPPSLKADPTPAIGSFLPPTISGLPLAQPVAGMPLSQPVGMGYSFGGIQTTLPGAGMPGVPLIQPQATLGTATMTTGSMLGLGSLMSNGVAGTFPHAGLPLTSSAPLTGVPGVSSLQSGSSIWEITPTMKMKYTQTFNLNDRNKKGFLLGVEACNILMQSGLPQPVLAQIWNLSDIDRDGKLTCDEFCIAMHLIELAARGQVLPASLPPELLQVKVVAGTQLPPVVPAPQKDAFSDLLTGVGLPPPSPAVSAPQPVEEEEAVSFEDKRKENFDKGQAELERRRAILREQQQKEEHERLEKERQEAEKRERQRQEAESRRQAELQRHLERQREKEREIEEQRRKVFEQREAAKRELERQQQMEWERQRKEQLIQEKDRESEQLQVLRLQLTNLRNDLEMLEAKKAELAVKISQVQKGVTDFTSGIDAMRMTRDKTLADIQDYEQQTIELNKKFSMLGNEKVALNSQVQTAQKTALSDTYKGIAESVDIKKASIQKLKSELEKIEKDTAVRLKEIDGRNIELKSLKEQLTQIEKVAQKQQNQASPQKLTQQKGAAKIPELTGSSFNESLASKTAGGGQDSWFDFNSSEAVSSVAASGGSSVNWDTAFAGVQGKHKYRALYDFPAGREDELTLVAGMEVWVLTDFTPVPGMEDWYKGEYQGQVGWFPKAYVERVDQPAADLFSGAFESLVQSSEKQSTEPSQLNQKSDTSQLNHQVDTNQLDLFSSQADQLSSAITSSSLADSLVETSNLVETSSFTLGGQPPPAPLNALNNLTAEPSTTKDQTAPSSLPGENYVAMYTYTSDEPLDLNFQEGDIINVTAATGDWWSGTLVGQNKSGMFPATYVRKMEQQGPVESSQPHVESSRPGFFIGTSTFDSELSELSAGTFSLHAPVSDSAGTFSLHAPVSLDLVSADLSFSFSSTHEKSAGNDLTDFGPTAFTTVKSKAEMKNNAAELTSSAFSGLDLISDFHMSGSKGSETESLVTTDFSNKTQVSATGHKAASNDHQLSWDLTDFGTPSSQSTMSSDLFLLDDMGSVSNSAAHTEKHIASVNQGALLDSWDDFMFNKPAEPSSNKEALKSSMSLPDILALEHDALEGDLLMSDTTASIMKSQDLLGPASQTWSLVQVDLEVSKPKKGSKQAPLPPGVKSLFSFSKNKKVSLNVFKLTTLDSFLKFPLCLLFQQIFKKIFVFVLPHPYNVLTHPCEGSSRLCFLFNNKFLFQCYYYLLRKLFLKKKNVYKYDKYTLTNISLLRLSRLVT